MELADKVVLVTGGGSGLGRAIGLAFAGRGADVGVNYPGFLEGAREAAEETARAIHALGRRAITLEADVAVDAEVRAMVAHLERALGRVDVLVNCAGTTVFVPLGDLEGMQEADWDRIMAVNAKGPFLCARAVVPLMRRQGAGRIVNVTSTSGLRPGGSCLAYAASKAANQMVMRSLARTLGPTITVNAVAPGLMDTAWGRRLGEAARERAVAEAALQRLPALADIAAAVVFLAENDSISGQTMIVDGGRHMPL